MIDTGKPTDIAVLHKRLFNLNEPKTELEHYAAGLAYELQNDLDECRIKLDDLEQKHAKP